MNKNEIICDYNKSEFQNFIEYDYEGKILEILDNEGIDILEQYAYKLERLEYIMCYSKYRNEIFQNERIADIMLSNVSIFYGNLVRLDFNTCIFLFNRSIEKGYDTTYLFNYLNKDFKEKIIDNWSYSDELLYSILSTENSYFRKKIIDKFNIDLSRVDLINFFRSSKEQTLMSKSENNNSEIELYLPSDMITKEVKEKIWNYIDIFKIRTIINDASYVIDTTSLNNYIKIKEMECIKSGVTDDIIEPFKTLYNYFYKIDNIKDDKVYSLKNECYEYAKSKGLSDMYIFLRRLYNEKGINDVYDHLKLLSNRYISNCIIDYYFEDIYHNVVININELLRYYFDGNISIPMDRLSIYERISNIDSLSIADKLELCIELDNINIMELFYDDMLSARTNVANSLKENAISSESLINYQDIELSNKYGINIYTNENIPFFGIVKSITNKTGYDDMPVGHSYSYVGDNNTSSYGDRTLLYDAAGFNPEQLIHVYPEDSFTFYRPFEYSTNSTPRVNNLLNAEELINESNGYNEILILEQGRKETELDSRIPKLKPIAVYCVDEITEDDIRLAKEYGIGIFLAKTKIKEDIKPINNYRGDINYMNYNYYENVNLENLEGKRVR